MCKFDIIIPAASKDISFLPTTVKYIKKNIVGYEKIYIITNESYFKKLSSLKSDTVWLIDENKLCDNLTITNVRSLAKSFKIQYRPGWYFQQFIKMGFALSPYCKEYYLSWDADTLPLHKLSFFDEDKPIFTKKYHHLPYYFETIQKILNLEKCVDFSFVAEHMLFNKEIMISLIKEIEKTTNKGNGWFQKILAACESTCDPYFSEFETYGTYCMTYHKDFYKTRNLNAFRHAGIIKGRNVNDRLVNLLAFDLDIASFEIGDKLSMSNRLQYYIYNFREYPISQLFRMLKFKIKSIM